MTAFFKRFGILVVIILAFQFSSPAFIKINADSPDGDIQKNIILNSLAIQFQNLPAVSIKAVIKDKLAYVTAGAAGLFIIDVHEPTNLRQVAWLDFPEAVSLIAINGSHLYLPARNNLYIVDITNPAQVSYTTLASMYTNTPLVSVATDSNLMLLAGEKNVMIFSLTEPSNPVMIASFCPDNAEESFMISDIALRGGTAYIARGEKGLGVYSLADLNNIVCKGRYDSTAGHCTGIDFIGDYAYLSTSDKNQMEIINISNIEKPDRCAEIKGICSIICADGNTAYAVGSTGKLSILDLAGFFPAVIVKEAVEVKDKDQKTAYITIDDGPSRSITPMNLDTLKKYGVKATFFVLPRSGVDDIYKRIIEEGHVIGNHSYSHDYNYLYSSTENFKKDIVKAKDLIYKKTGYTSTVFRFPGGTMGRGKSIIKARADILAGLGYRYFDWDVSTADTDPNLKKYGTEEYIINLLANNVIKNTKNRKKLVILMHDSSGKIYSAKALPKIIEGLQKQGYVFDVLTNY